MRQGTTLSKTLFALILLVLLSSCATSKIMQKAPAPIWESLFNGKDIKGWTTKIHHYEAGDNHGETFRAEDGLIKVRYDQYQGDFDDRYGHLYYDKPYSFYHLSLDYRFVGELHSGAPYFTKLNSGLMFHSQDPQTMPREQDWPISVEIQFLAGIEEGKIRPTGNMCSPGTDVIYNGQIDPRHCINSNSDTYYGDQWVHAELIVLGDSLITHIINGKEVLQYTKPQVGGGVAQRYDPAYKIDGTALTSGFIALQSEGQPIDFKNIKIKNLKGCMDPKASNYGSHFISPDPQSCSY